MAWLADIYQCSCSNTPTTYSQSLQSTCHPRQIARRELIWRMATYPASTQPQGKIQVHGWGSTHHRSVRQRAWIMLNVSRTYSLAATIRARASASVSSSVPKVAYPSGHVGAQALSARHHLLVSHTPSIGKCRLHQFRREQATRLQFTFVTSAWKKGSRLLCVTSITLRKIASQRASIQASPLLSTSPTC